MQDTPTDIKFVAIPRPQIITYRPNILRVAQVKIVVWVLVFLVAWLGWPLWAQGSADVFDIYFFHSETCPHCAEQMPLMEAIEQYNEDVDIHFIEVNQDPDTWQTFRERYTIISGAVPRTIIGDKSFVGYSSSDGPLEYAATYSGYIGYRNQILQAIADLVGHEVYLANIIPPSEFRFPWWVFGFPLAYLASYIGLKGWLQSVQWQRYWIGGWAASALLSLFLMIRLTPDAVIAQFAQTLPLPVFVATVALADGFNPCAFTVLIILLSLLTYTKRRRDMTLIGGTFILTSGAMYFLFIMVMIGVGSILIEHYGNLLMLILGLGITLAGLINVKDYFWFKSGVSLSLSTGQQRQVSQKAGKIIRTLKTSVDSPSQVLAALGGTVALAVFVNLIELGCTAILPVVYMTTLVSYCDANLGPRSWLCYSSWTALYAAIYIIPLFLILANFIYSFESSRFTESQGRIMKLVAGLFMLFFGLIMIIKPNLLMFR